MAGLTIEEILLLGAGLSGLLRELEVFDRVGEGVRLRRQGLEGVEDDRDEDALSFSLVPPDQAEGSPLREACPSSSRPNSSKACWTSQPRWRRPRMIGPSMFSSVKSGKRPATTGPADRSGIRRARLRARRRPCGNPRSRPRSLRDGRSSRRERNAPGPA